MHRYTGYAYCYGAVATLFLSGSMISAFAKPLPHASPRQQTSSDAVTHPFTKPVPVPLPPEQDAQATDATKLRAERQMETVWTYLQPPVSLVEIKNKTAVYSAAINEPLCVAYRGDKEWLGTPVGVKCVDKQAQRVTIYAARSGLAPGRVERVFTNATGDSAVALVRRSSSDGSPESHYDVCLYEPSTSRWKTLGNLPVPTGNGFSSDPAHGSQWTQITPDFYQVALTESRVFVIATSTKTDTPSATCYDRATGKSETTALPENIKADFPMIRVNAAFATNDKFYLGSDIGLLCYDPATRTWQRYLPGQDILQMVPGIKDKDSATILFRPRKRERDDTLMVAAVSLATGKTVGDSLPYPKSNYYSLGTLSLAPDDTPWITAGSVFYGVTPDRKTWQCYFDDGTELQQSSYGKGLAFEFERARDQAFRGIIQPVAPANKVPDNAVIPRVFRPPVGSSSAALSHFSAQEPMRWMRQRLSRWLSPPGSQDKPVASL